MMHSDACIGPHAREHWCSPLFALSSADHPLHCLMPTTPNTFIGLPHTCLCIVYPVRTCSFPRHQHTSHTCPPCSISLVAPHVGVLTLTRIKSRRATTPVQSQWSKERVGADIGERRRDRARSRRHQPVPTQLPARGCRIPRQANGSERRRPAPR
jgi:hypothetical protein